MMEQNIKDFSLSKPTCTSSLTLLYAPPQSHLSICLNEDGIIFLNQLLSSLSPLFVFFFFMPIVRLSQLDRGILIYEHQLHMALLLNQWSSKRTFRL